MHTMMEVPGRMCQLAQEGITDWTEGLLHGEIHIPYWECRQKLKKEVMGSDGKAPAIDIATQELLHTDIHNHVLLLQSVSAGMFFRFLGCVLFLTCVL